MSQRVMKQRSRLLLLNGIVLGAIASAQFMLDFAGYWYGFGPTGPALHGNLDTIGFAEAHGLAAGFSLSADPSPQGWLGGLACVGCARAPSLGRLQPDLLANL